MQKSTAISTADTTTNINPGISSDGYASNMIASGQAFFIQATSASQSLTFRESAKSTTQPTASNLIALLSTPADKGLRKTGGHSCRHGHIEGCRSTISSITTNFIIIGRTDIEAANDKGLH
ncbi:hypothetical protein ACFJIV_18240 [Mucilaginibacter sp. UC70_90]